MKDLVVVKDYNVFLVDIKKSNKIFATKGF